ncbi:MAG TPA: diguanylate cyclase [Dongiaceae bacterium]|nr:diguanylate cyclase [Dongiaceae bacterium]
MLLAFLLLTWWIPAVANSGGLPTVSLNADTEYLPLGKLVDFHIDQSGTASLANLLLRPASDWQPNRQGTVNFGQSPVPYWFRVRLKGLDQLRDSTFLRVDYPHLDELDVFLVKDGQILTQYHTGDTTPFASRPIPYRTYLFPLNAHQGNQGSTADIYVRVATDGMVQVPLDILSQAGLDQQDKQSYLWYGAFFGIMIVMLFYNSLIFIFVRDLSYALYLFYIVATAFLQFTLHGFSFQYLWPGSSTFNNSMIMALTGLMPFTAVAFAWSFIGLSKLGSRNDKIAVTVMFLGFSTVLVGAFTMPYGTVLKMAHLFSFAAVTLGFYLGVKYWLKGVKAARIFALAWFANLVFILLYLLDIKGIIQPHVISQHALEIGAVIELVLLSLAFADRLNAEKELRLNAQVKLTNDLDLLVRERTEELEAANRKLKEVSVTDGLTGLFNRRHFDEVFANEYQRAFREKQTLSVIMVDLDHFKKINDTYGHPFGDLCLQEAAAIIRKAIHRPPDMAARYGGEEFVVLLPNTDVAGALCVAETIRANLEACKVSDGNYRINLSASLGVSGEIPPERDTREQLLKRVDGHLYEAKHGGRNQVVADTAPETTAPETVITSPSPSSQKAM